MHSAFRINETRLPIGQPRYLYQRIMPQTAARVVRSEPLFLKERGPDLPPPPRSQEVGANFYSQSWPFGERGSRHPELFC
jgi:hypothetical protein